MKQAMFSFSPDGGQRVYMIPLDRRTLLILLIVLGAVLLALAFMVVGIFSVVSLIVQFFLTASIEALLRLLFLLIVCGLVQYIVRGISKPSIRSAL